MADTSLSSGMRWSGVSVIGREVSRTIFTILLARLVGPDDFGIVAQAMVYVNVVGLLLDQGFSSALIQRKQIEPDVPGAVVSVNLAVGAALTAATVAIAPLWASFMRTPQLLLVLVVLAPKLFIGAGAITPRAMLIRSMEFRKIGIADTAAAMSGGALGLAVALAGGGYWAVVVQVLSTDIVLLLMLLVLGGASRPNLHFRQLREIAAFSGRAFAAGLLINSVSRNIDNLLVGRFQGAQALAFYGLAYRLLLLPVQLASTTVGRVLFPAFARLAPDLTAMGAEMARASRALAALSLPVMALAAAAAPQLVAVIFGAQWKPAIPIVQVLAIAGALQAIYQPTTAPLVLGGFGHAKLNLRYAWLTTVVATLGIVAGLPFGPFGVAVGYSTATGLLVPVEWLIRRHLLGMTVRGQIASLMPAVHVALWVAGAYLVIAAAIPGHEMLALALGTVIAGCTGAAVLRLAHRSLWAELVHMINRIVGRGGPPEDSPRVTPPSGTVGKVGIIRPVDVDDGES
jgi:O-antigen/teichoic acid export membrane protein